MNARYESAKAIYASYGVDTEKVIETLKNVPVSMHCWQGDDVIGFDHDGPLTGGIQTTGNYPGKARTPEELLAEHYESCIRIPMKEHMRSLNLSNSVAIIAYEVLRQFGFEHLKQDGELTKQH